MKYEYSVLVVWSKENEAYLAFVAELPGCIADGPTQEAAIANVREVAKEWVEVAIEEKRPVPPPMSSEDREGLERANQIQIREAIKQSIAQAVNEIVPRIIQQFIKEQSQREFSFRSGQWYQIELPSSR